MKTALLLLLALTIAALLDHYANVVLGVALVLFLAAHGHRHVRRAARRQERE